jgi:hypothetical protein
MHAGSFDRFAGYGAFESVAAHVIVVDSQFDAIGFANMNVCVGRLDSVLANLLSLDLIRDTFVVEAGGNRFDTIGKDMNVDIRALTHMARQNAANEFGMELANQSHHSQRSQSHVSQRIESRWTLVHTSERLNGVSNFGIGGQIGWLDPTLAQSSRSFLFRSVVFGLFV